MKSTAYQEAGVSLDAADEVVDKDYTRENPSAINYVFKL